MAFKGVESVWFGALHLYRTHRTKIERQTMKKEILRMLMSGLLALVSMAVLYYGFNIHATHVGAAMIGCASAVIVMVFGAIIDESNEEAN